MDIATDTLLQNRYRIESLIARGGMGSVYKATDQRLGNTVALKQIFLTDPYLRETLEQEARLLARLQHPSLPMVTDHFAEDNEEFLVMQFIPGDDLGLILKQDDEMFAPTETLHWADQLLDALEYLHGQKPSIIHRDIKPRNLKLTPRRDIMLLDFGLARGPQMVYKSDGNGRNKRLVTPQYAPLEQIQGADSDPRSDLYALAATLYHLLTGTTPIDALSRAAALLSEQTDPLRPANELNPQIPPAVALILHQAMSPSLEQRFATATAMRTALSMVYRSGNTFIQSGLFANSSSGQTTVPMIHTSSKEKEKNRAVNNAEQLGAGVDEPTTDNTKKTTNSSGIHTPSTSSTSLSSGRGMASKPLHTEPRPSPSPLPLLIVCRQGNGHYQTIRQAIAHALPGTRIFVRPGIYHEHLVIDKTLEIIGDGAASDIFIESTEAPCVEMQTDYAIVRGVTLRGRGGTVQKEFVAVDIPLGRLVLEACDISSDTQACIAIHNADANPIIWRCHIHDSKNAGILVYEHGEGIIEECDVYSNSGAGIEITRLGNPIIRRCKIHHGERDGVLVYQKGAGFIERCDIFSNARAGVSVERGGNPFVRLCVIHDQINGYGVYIHTKGYGTIEGCDIVGNAKAGIGITQGGNPLVRRCQIHHEKQRGIFIFEKGEGTIERSYILSNADTGITIGQECKPYIRRCHINHNSSAGIRVLPHGGGNIVDCNLTGNGGGAWDVATKTHIVQHNNTE